MNSLFKCSNANTLIEKACLYLTYAGIVASLLFICSINAFAAEASNDEVSESEIRIQEVEVRSRIDQPGQKTLDATFLRMAPSHTGTVNDALRNSSFVQYDMSSRNGLMGGEITPPKLSIRGAQHYENNFMLNGMGMNNYLNPSGYDPSLGWAAQITSDPQSLILDTGLMENVTVYTENVPAKYGKFLGGAVNSTLRAASTDRWHGAFNYRYSGSDWANIHYYEDDGPDEYRTNVLRQSRFTNHDVSARADGPLWGGLGLSVAFSQKYASIPMQYNSREHETVNTSRRNQNYMLRLNTPTDETFSAALTAIYAPYVQKLVNTAAMNSENTVKGGGWNIMLETKTKFDFGTWENNIGYSTNEASREVSSPATFFSWRTVPGGYANWGAGTASNQGTGSNMEQKQRTINFSSDMDFTEFNTGGLLHSVNAGIQFEHVHASLQHDPVKYMLQPQLSSTVVGTHENGVIAGEQWLRDLYLRPARDVSLSFATFAAYLEDTMKLERFTLRLGARLDYENLSNNINIAPRTFANVDLLDDGRFNLYGGYNRYYGGQIITRAVNIINGTWANVGEVYRRALVGNTPGDWALVSRGNYYANELGDLKTPYSDEFNAGFGVNLWDTNFNVIGVVRKHRDQILTSGGNNDTGPVKYINAGRTDYWGVTFSVDREFDLGSFGKHLLELSATRSDTKGNNITNGLASIHEQPGSEPDYVYLNGTKTDKSNLSARNFNSPWVVTLSHNASFWDERLRLFSVLRYEKGYPGMRYDTPSSIVEPSTGLNVSRWKNTKLPDTLNADMTVEFDVFRHKGSTLSVIGEVTNVMDRKNLMYSSTSATADPTYSMGRRFYAGVRFEF